MKLSINPQSSIPIYAQIIEQIESLILSGILSPGSSLSSIRDLAEQLDVNSLTIQKAYKQLESQNLINIKKGIGAFVRNDIHTMPEKEKYKKLSIRLQPIIQYAKELNINKEKFIEIINNLWRK